jgi:hypothetical protein
MAAAILLKFLSVGDFKTGASFEMLCKTLRWREELKSLGFMAIDGKLLLEESLRCATVMEEGGKAGCLPQRVRAMAISQALLCSQSTRVCSRPTSSGANGEDSDSAEDEDADGLAVKDR